MNKIELLKLNNNKENLIISPYSLLIALSMLREGAEGSTKEELDNIIKNEDITNLDNIDKVLSTCNKMYIKKSDSNLVNDSYKETINTKYKAEIELSDLTDVNIINKYVEDKTFGQIKDILERIDGNLLLINTLAVDMGWPYEISGREVRSGNFNGLEASYIYGFYKYNTSLYYDDDVMALGIDLKEYDNNKYECVLIEPQKLELNEYINSIDDNKLNDILNGLKSLKEDNRTINIAVPKFSFDYDLNTENTFSKLGLNFDNLNLSKITDIVDDMSITHKANIDFSEKGLKAAAATIIKLLCGCAYVDPSMILNIKIEKPFIFVLREKNTNTILFIGTVYNPILWKDDKDNYKTEY